MLLPDDEREIERRMNVHRLKNEAKEIVGGEMTVFESDAAPAEVLEEFWKHVVEFERAPLVTTHQKLEAAGLPMPPDSQLSDEALHTRLWQIIEWLAARQTFLYDTDHLSDRELYRYLREEGFTEPIPDLSPQSMMRHHLSPIGSGNEKDTWINFRFYADEDSRRSWMEQFPDYEMPPREPAPYNRDHLLPQADYGLPSGEDWDDDEWGDQAGRNTSAS